MKFIFSGVAVFFLMSCSFQSHTEQVPDKSNMEDSKELGASKNLPQTSAVPNQLLVLLKKNADSDAVRQEIHALGGKVLMFMPEQNLFQVQTRREKVEGMELEKYQNIQGVSSVERNIKRQSF